MLLVTSTLSFIQRVMREGSLLNGSGLSDWIKRWETVHRKLDQVWHRQRKMALGKRWLEPRRSYPNQWPTLLPTMLHIHGSHNMKGTQNYHSDTWHRLCLHTNCRNPGGLNSSMHRFHVSVLIACMGFRGYNRVCRWPQICVRIHPQSYSNPTPMNNSWHFKAKSLVPPVVPDTLLVQEVSCWDLWAFI